MLIPEPPKLPTPPPTRYISDHGDKKGNIPVTTFLYGMWFMWFCLCVIARGSLTPYSFVIGAVIIPGLLVLLARGVWFLVRLVKFKWEKRDNGAL